MPRVLRRHRYGIQQGDGERNQVCGSCNCFKYEDANGYGECDHHDVPENYFDVRYCSEYCGNWMPKTV